MFSCFSSREGKSTYTDPRLAFAVEDRTAESLDATSGVPGGVSDCKARAEELQRHKQRFDASSTALQVLVGVDLTDRTILITGPTSGIGKSAKAVGGILPPCHVLL